MADDLMVAVYANLILRGVAYALPGWLDERPALG
jgi:hypothetical protein